MPSSFHHLTWKVIFEESTGNQIALTEYKTNVYFPLQPNCEIKVKRYKKTSVRRNTRVSCQNVKKSNCNGQTKKKVIPNVCPDQSRWQKKHCIKVCPALMFTREQENRTRIMSQGHRIYHIYLIYYFLTISHKQKFCRRCI